MKEYKKDFIEFALSKNALQFGDFTLKSGRKSPYFFNAGLFNSGLDLSLLGKFYSETIISNKLEFDVLFGPAYKGIPLATSIAITLANNFNINKPYCFNRKEAKDHGEGGNLVGAKLNGDILLIDDVITAGTAIKESMAIIKASNANLKHVLIALDRQEKGITNTSAVKEIEENYHCKVYSIINLSELIRFIKIGHRYSQYLPAFEQYQDQYGIE